MEKQFVTYEIASQLKELGFNEECLGYFKLNEMENHYHISILMYNKLSSEILAPLWQQIIEWLGEKYDIKIQIEPTHACYNIGIYKYYEDEDNNLELPTDGLNFKDFLDYYECREQAILKAIEIINESRINIIS